MPPNLNPMPPIPNSGTKDLPLNPEEIDDGGVLATDSQTDEQIDSDTLLSFYKRLIFTSIIVVLAVIVILAGISFCYKGAPCSASKSNASKNRQRTVHGSLESVIDSNHNHRLREQAFPLRALSTMHNWLNRKKRLFTARRRRRSSRLPNQPKTRAMVYTKNGRTAAALATFGTSSSSTHWSVGSNQSRSSTSPTDLETMAALITAQNNRVPPISLVSNPNYFSEAEQHLLENTCKHNPCDQKCQ